jgi:hypothetical protein
MSSAQFDPSKIEIKNDNDCNPTISNKSVSLNALNTDLLLLTNISGSLTPLNATSPDSVKAKLNGLLMLSKKSSINSLKQDLSRGSSLEQIDPSYLSAISSSVILSPCPSPSPDSK